MAVKRSASAARMMQVFEAIAMVQPVGVSALARRLDADKSAVQRDLMTLADAGWIRPLPGRAGLWELTPRILTLANTPYSTDELRQRARPVLAMLRAKTAETAYLIVPNGDQFVVIDALESPLVLRMMPPVGLMVPLRGSATARAVLPYLTEAEQIRLLGEEPSARICEQFAATRRLGYAVNNGDIVPEAFAIASAVLDANDRPLGALVLTGAAQRFEPQRQASLGALLFAAARSLTPGSDG